MNLGGGGGGGGKAHKMSGMEEGENWSKLRSWPGGLLLTPGLILEGEMQITSFWLGVNLNSVLHH